MLKFSGYSWLIGGPIGWSGFVMNLVTCEIKPHGVKLAFRRRVVCDTPQGTRTNCRVQWHEGYKIHFMCSSQCDDFMTKPAIDASTSNQNSLDLWGWTDTPTDILPEGSARCVQSFDDSLDFAIRMTYRISLRSSSLWEPRHPLLKVFFRLWIDTSIPSSKKKKRSCLVCMSCFHHISLFWKFLRLSNQWNKVWGMGSTSDPEVVIRWLHGTKKKRWGFDTPSFPFGVLKDVVMILPQVHLRKPCYDFTFL